MENAATKTQGDEDAAVAEEPKNEELSQESNNEGQRGRLFKPTQPAEDLALTASANVKSMAALKEGQRHLLDTTPPANLEEPAVGIVIPTEEAIPIQVQALPATCLTRASDRSRPGAYANAPGIDRNHRRPDISFDVLGRDDLLPPENRVTGNATVDNAGLVEARAVDDEERALATATPASKVEEQSYNTWLDLCVCLLVFAALVFMIIWWSGRSDDGSSPELPTAPPTGIPPLQYIQQYLPAETLETIQQDPSSPQAQAMEWMTEDPFLFDLESLGRLQQRYALATVYFALNGTFWTKNWGWLSYEIHECDWWQNTSENVMHDMRPAESPCRGQDNANTNATEYEYRYYTHLWLGKNGLKGTIPLQELTLLSHLESIDFQQSRHLQGPLFTADLLKLSNLKEISAMQNQLTGTIMTEIGLMTNLEVLFLGKRGNRFSGTLPTELGLLTNLEVLSLSASSFNGTVPTEIGTMSNLSILGLAGTKITGSLPSEIGLLDNLWLTYMFRGQFTGQIPSQVGQLETLEWIYLNSNFFTGAIPSQLGLVESLKEINLSGNQLSSEIPTELGQISTLFELELNDNSLVGPMPTQLGHLIKLQILNVANNHLSGTIPVDTFYWPDITLFDMSSNPGLTGEVPAALCDKLGNESLSFDCRPGEICGCDWCSCEAD